MDIHDRLAALEAQQRELTAHIAALRSEVETTAPAASRRDLFKKLGVAAAGAVGGAMVLGGARPAAAADAGQLTLGAGGNANNTSQTPTLMTYTAGAIGAANVLTVQSLGTATPATSAYPSVVAGWASTAAGPPNGLYGFSGVTGGYGAVAFGNTATSGLAGNPATGLLARGGVANMELTAEGNPPASRTDAHRTGELIADALGTLWYCVEGGTPGTWRQLAAKSSAGQLHVFSLPFRIVDTRAGTGPASTGAGPVPSGTQRTVDLRSGWQDTLIAPALPGGSTAALLTLTLADTVTSGFLAVIADGAPYQGTSNVNWSTTGALIATTVIAPVNNGKIAVRAGGAGTTNFVVDLLGWFG